jgi:hypothetical protein
MLPAYALEEGGFIRRDVLLENPVVASAAGQRRRRGYPQGSPSRPPGRAYMFQSKCGTEGIFMEGKKMMMQPSKEEYEICEKLKKCTDEKKRKILEEKWIECIRKNPIPELDTHRINP